MSERLAKTGETMRNVGIATVLLSVVLFPELFFPGLGLAAGGEIFRRETAKASK